MSKCREIPPKSTIMDIVNKSKSLITLEQYEKYRRIKHKRVLAGKAEHFPYQQEGYYIPLEEEHEKGYLLKIIINRNEYFLFRSCISESPAYHFRALRREDTNGIYQRVSGQYAPPPQPVNHPFAFHGWDISPKKHRGVPHWFLLETHLDNASPWIIGDISSGIGGD